MLRYLIMVGALLLSGCALLPDIAHEPQLHNPFPQLTKVAVAPFFNLSAEPTVDGRRFAIAYFNELQLVPGFEVIPVGVTERAMHDHGISMAGPHDAQRLAQMLGVDAVIVGAVTEYSPYYPPRMALQVEWYAANPCFHPIPPGYGLPWGTPDEENIPASLIFEAEFALAQAQLKTQTPTYNLLSAAGKGNQKGAGGSGQPGSAPRSRLDPGGGTVQHLSYDEAADPTATTATTDATDPPMPGFPPDWPDPRGFIPPPPQTKPSACKPSGSPVLRHEAAYNGSDLKFTEALGNYWHFRDDARYGGWQASLERSEDFILFCCHMHIWEMLSARGGAGETRVVWRWPKHR